ncbi:MAG: di-heme enzyme [Gemmatimonadetes bacterium]|nr:di-heme enzyme [Gemmatimonadota bacterium]
MRGRVTRAMVACGALAFVASAACGGDEVLGPLFTDPTPTGSFAWILPDGFPEPRVPVANPMTDEKVELGRHLFYDLRLSGNRTQSCASCHRQSAAFTDALPRSLGSTGEVHPRNAQSLANVGYQPVLTWANPSLELLSEQALTPMFGTEPVELGLAGLEEELILRIEEDATYERLFGEAYPEDSAVTLEKITAAIASFQRTLISGDSPVDRDRLGEPGAISDAARLGQALFFSERLECFHCHGGLMFTGTVDWAGKSSPESEFHNNGLYNLDAEGSYPEPNNGLFNHTGRSEDRGRFKAPSLRNVALTAPYMHDGSIATLDEVIDHYAAAGRNVTTGSDAGDGRANPNKSGFVKGFTLTPTERAALIEFLEALTDSAFIAEPRFSNPWPPDGGR